MDPLSKMSIGVHQISCSSTSNAYTEGFRSRRGHTGEFKHCFERQGQYCFSSGYIDNSEQIEFKRGKVTVGDLKQSVANISVKVNGKFNFFSKDSYRHYCYYTHYLTHNCHLFVFSFFCVIGTL